MLDEPDPGQAYSGPLAVLVDRTSASASEIFAGAIQDYHRGLIIGQTTFGKGTVQSVIPLDRWSSRPTEGQVTVTIGKFYRVTGESTQLRGVTPDIVLPSPISTDDVGESVLEHALPWDRIAIGAVPRPGRPSLPWCRRWRARRATAPRTTPTISGCSRASASLDSLAPGKDAVTQSEEAPGRSAPRRIRRA